VCTWCQVCLWEKDGHSLWLNWVMSHLQEGTTMMLQYESVLVWEQSTHKNVFYKIILDWKQLNEQQVWNQWSVKPSLVYSVSCIHPQTDQWCIPTNDCPHIEVFCVQLHRPVGGHVGATSGGCWLSSSSSLVLLVSSPSHWQWQQETRCMTYVLFCILSIPD